MAIGRDCNTTDNIGMPGRCCDCCQVVDELDERLKFERRSSLSDNERKKHFKLRLKGHFLHVLFDVSEQLFLARSRSRW